MDAVHAVGNQLGFTVELEAKDGYFLANMAQHGLAGDDLPGRGPFRALNADHHIDLNRRADFTAAVVEVKVDDIFAGRRAAAIAHFVI